MRVLDESQYTNYDICAQCGGVCCKKGGCQYEPSDFEKVQMDYLMARLSEGHISIVAYIDGDYENGHFRITPKLYLKARNANRPVIDLLSMRTACSCLTENGCLHDFATRPSGGINLIPGEDGTCYHKKTPEYYIESWRPYQPVLRRIVKTLSGMSVEARLKEDAYLLFQALFRRDIEGVSEDELKIILSGLTEFALMFPEEYRKAIVEHRMLFPGDPMFKQGGRR